MRDHLTKIYDLIIIGAGPSGLTAALYAGRSRMQTLVLERLSIGGRILLSETIENFPGFSSIATNELMERMHQQAKAQGVEFLLEEVVGLDAATKTVVSTSGSFSASAIIIATGARPRKLNVPGETRLTGRGVSYCATCDAPFYNAKDVLVIGGGNAVAEEALYLTRFAKQVTIVHRREELRASAILQERLKANPKVKFILGFTITEILGEKKVESVNLKNVLTGRQQDIACDGIFIYIGYDPDTDFIKSQVNLDDAGFVITDEFMATSRQGIFACGDCRKKGLYQVITACSDGAIAADAAYKYMANINKGK